MVYVPIVAASGLERHIGHDDLFYGKHAEIALSDEILRECVIGVPSGEHIVDPVHDHQSEVNP